MRYDAAWNLVGVPPDAKDIAQTAAQEAGLSIGEWLTRSILSSIEEIEIPEETKPRTEQMQRRGLSDRAAGSRPGTGDLFWIFAFGPIRSNNLA